jgi:hypothetical protein
MPNAKSTWVPSRSMTPVPGVTPMSPLCPWYCGHPRGEVSDAFALLYLKVVVIGMVLFFTKANNAS